ncbi:MAG: cadmium-translocating P-type ATPase [Pseudoflavonifractor sp.]|nr:cadmium-translocating P-type ATPase [Pseudoflavonifractor sp.]MDY3020347.1 heavy metal translocating P-type ATPase [Oscillospiraceae bacterium]
MTPKQKKMLTRIAVSAVLFGAAEGLTRAVSLPGWAVLTVFLVPYLVIGWDILWRAARNIAHGQVFDENFLMALATLGALAIGEYPESVFVMLFYQVGEFFQSWAVGRSRQSIAALMDIRPDYANLEENGSTRRVDPEDVTVGETIVIRPGERVPLDGVVLEGVSTLNTAALTGESLPRDIQPGDDVISGCVNLTGVLRVRTTKEFGDSTVAKILDLVENAGSRKARSEQFITRFARWYTPVVVGSAVLLAVLPPLITGGDWAKWLEQALIFLVISCPCALVISVPLTFFGGIGGASRQGVLVKGSNYLEALARTETVVFDKTGTLTRGVFNVTAIHPDECSEARLLELAALAESYSTHPIARSLREAYGLDIEEGRVTGVEELAGRGVKAEVDGRPVYVGNDRLMEEVGASWHPCHHVGTTVHVAFRGEYLGHIVISDEIKPDAREAIAALKRAGIRRTVMLTGDAQTVGEAVGRELGLDEVHAQLLPADKVDRVERLLAEKSPKGTLAFVGDGINDAPVLSRSDVGIAMGALGSDAAIEAADVVLMDDKPSKIAAAISIARRTLSIARQNIIFALGVKAVFLIMGLFGVANLWEAVFADVGVSVLAILNAARALKSKE